MPEHCETCGAEISDTTEICPGCGANIRLIRAERKVALLEGALDQLREALQEIRDVATGYNETIELEDDTDGLRWVADRACEALGKEV